MTNCPQVVLCTCPDLAVAQDIAEQLVKRELPELIAFSIAGGSKAYLDWISDSVGQDLETTSEMIMCMARSLIPQTNRKT